MKKIIGIVCIALAVLALVAGVTSGGSTLLGGVIIAAILAIVGLRFLRTTSGKQSPETVPAPSAEPAAPAPVATEPTPQPMTFQQRKDQAGVINFRIAGVTFGSRQTTLRKIDEGEDEKYLMCTYGIEQTEYKGEPAFSIYAELMDDKDTRKELGFVPKELVPNVLQIYNRIFAVDVKVYGGEDDKSYGAAATLYYDK